MRVAEHNTTVYETIEEIKAAIAEKCDLHDARLIDILMTSDKKDVEYAFQYRKHVYNFVFIDLYEYSIYCNNLNDLYVYEITVEQEPDGIKTCFDGIGMEFKSKKLEMIVRYNGLE